VRVESGVWRVDSGEVNRNMDNCKVEAVIFDMDGLMFDTESIAVDAWAYSAGRFGYNLTPEMLIETIGLNMEKSLKVFEKYFDYGFTANYDEIVAGALKYQKDHIIKNGIPLKKGLFELLDFLKANNIKTAVATSTDQKEALYFIERAGIKDRFDSIICGDMIANSKPAPDIFLKAAAEMRVSPYRCMVLEDSPGGISGAYKAGMIPVMVPDLKQPDEKIKPLLYAQCGSLPDVIDLLITILLY